MEISFKQAYFYIKTKWYGTLLAYIIVVLFLYLGIWSIIEPIDFETEKRIIDIDIIFNNRIKNHVLICLIIAPYITLLLVLFKEYSLEKKYISFEETLYNGKKPNKSDFQFGNKKRWNSISKQNYGEIGKGSFTITEDLISIERFNNEGSSFIDLHSYFTNGVKSKYVKRTLQKGGFREINVRFKIKLSGKGSQSIFFILKHYDSSDWIASKNLNIETNSWEEHSLFFKIGYHKDFNLRIDCREVSNPPSSIQIKDLEIIQSNDE